MGRANWAVSATCWMPAASGIVLRTSWVYAAVGKNFVLTMLRLMREKDRINVVCDQIGAPTWAASAAAAIWGLIETAAKGGIYHWTDLGVASWYDFAVAIQDEALARGLLSRTYPHHANPERLLSDAGSASRFQRPGYGLYASVD